VILTLLAPRAASAAAAAPHDLAPAALLVPGLFLLVLLLALPIALLGPGHARTRRSLALLIVLVALFGILSQALPLPLGSFASLAVFLGIFVVIVLMGRFDIPE
jgi:hypothetical protein